MRTALTQQQAALLAFIREFVGEKGFAPTFDEMKDALDLRSKSGIHRLIGALKERGFVRRMPNRPRSIDLVDDAPPFGPNVEREIRRRCAVTGTTRAAVIRQAVEQFLEVRG